MESIETLSREDAKKALKLIQNLLTEEPENKNTVPASIFQANLSPFQALATYLHQQNKTPKEIARELGRSKQFVSNSISQDTLKHSGRDLPISIFRRDLSVLEAAALFLHEQGLSNTEIAAELGKSPSTVWITLHRAKKKRGESDE